MDITLEQWEKWCKPNRPHIQHIFPQLNAADREFIMTGMTDEDWDATFPPEEDEPTDEEWRESLKEEIERDGEEEWLK